MKIIGFHTEDEITKLVVKGDSALLNQRKPLFVPDWTKDLRYYPATVVRICRLGKNIQPRFAERYYDAVADGADMIAWDWLTRDHARATSFDGALAVGEWEAINAEENKGVVGESQDSRAIDIASAVSEASKVMTLRMGDLVFITEGGEPISLQREDVIERGSLYCKIK